MKVEKTKEIIVSVANKLFSRFGFHKTSMDEIAKIARKAKGSLYYHFASKEDLFKEVVHREIENLKNHLSEIVNSPDLNASEKIKKYLLKRMELLNNAANYHETLKADFFEYFHFVDDLRVDLDVWEKKNIKKIINEGVQAGEFLEVENMEAMLDVFIMVLKGVEMPFFVQNKYNQYVNYFEGLINILIKGISK